MTSCNKANSSKNESCAPITEPVDENRLLAEAEIAFYLSGCLAFISDVQGHELKKREMEQTGEYKRTENDLKKLKRLKEIEGLIVKISDLYLPENGWDPEDLKKADKAVDAINEKFKEIFA